MKTRSKLLLAAVSLLTVSVAATATSAYAWYTANRQVQANLNNVTTYADNSSLATELVTGCDFTRKKGETDNTNNGESSETAKHFETTKSLSDVSSSGNGTYVKPKWDAKGTKVVGWYTQDQAKGYSLKLSINFWATSKNDLYLFVEDTSVFSVPTEEGLKKSAALSARYSITQTQASGESTTTSVLAYAAPNETQSEASPLKYAAGTDAAETAIGSLKTNSVDVTTIWDSTFFDKNATRHSAQQISNGTEAEARQKGYVVKLPGTTTPQTPTKVQLDFNIWIEGMDTDCSFAFTKDSTTFTASIDLALNFYALENVTFKTEQTTQA